jgi:predicted ester cyclase
MSVELNKIIIRKFIEEVINQRNFDALDEVCNDNAVWHFGSMKEIHGIKEFRRQNTEAGGAAAFPDFQIIIDEMFADANKVAVRYSVEATHKGEFMGVRGTGKKVNWNAIVLFEMYNDKIKESWTCEDTLGLMQQIGVKKIPESK